MALAVSGRNGCGGSVKAFEVADRAALSEGCAEWRATADAAGVNAANLLPAELVCAVRCGFACMEDRQALHVVALSGPRQQDIGRQTSVVADAPVLKSCGGIAQPGRDHHWPERYGFRCILSTVIVSHSQAEGRHSHGAQDRRAVLQCRVAWHDLSRSRRSRLR